MNYGLTTIAALISTGTLFAGIHKLTPSGGDDTAAVQAALDRCATDSDCIVDFAAGVYRTRQVYTKGFRGVIRGAGSNTTLVEPFGTLDMQESFTTSQYPDPSYVYPNLWSFINGSIKISDIGFRVLSENPVKPYQNNPGFPGPNPATHMLALVYVAGERADLDVERCSFEGAKGNFFDGQPGEDKTNLHWGVVFWGLAPNFIDGGLRVASTRFQNMASGLTIQRVRNRLNMIGGGPEDGNTFERACLAMEIFNLDNSALEVAHNTFHGCNAGYPLVWIEQYIRSGRPWTEQAGRDVGLSTILISKNQFYLNNGIAISLADYIRDGVDGRMADYIVSGNHVWCEAGQLLTVTNRGQALPDNTWTGAGVVVSKNFIEGKSTARAIGITRALHATITGTDASKFTTTSPSTFILRDSIGGILSGDSGIAEVAGIGADTHTIVGVRRLN
ncbi:MAG: hypothetical protein IT167_11190 [Bryobacterales bacterium]|nr:hypothetical protein [Bryobacterales bacterium]